MLDGLTLEAREAGPAGRPLRIAIYLQDLSGGGVERMRLHLIEELRRAGAEVRLLLHAARGEHLSAVPAEVEVEAFGTRRVRQDLLPLARALRHHAPDILLASLGHNNIAAACAGVLAGGRTKVILTQHNALSQEARAGWKYRLLPAAYRATAPFAAAIVAVSEGVACDMARVTGIARRRIEVIHNPVIDSDFVARAAAPVPHPWLRQPGPPVFITAGRLVPQKDHATLLAAFARFRATAAGRLIVLGSGPCGETLRNLALRLGIAGDVAFPGYVANPLPWFRGAAAFVLSSAYEGFGNVLVEALGCGLPVISTDCPHGPSEILDGGRFGTLVPVGDALALAGAMSAVLRDRIDAAVLRGRAARFTGVGAAEAYLRLMRRVLAARR